MGTFDVRKFLNRFKIPLIVVVLLLMVAIGYLASPYSPTRMCTLMGCRDSLEIILSVEPAQVYEVSITTPEGDSRSVSCTPGESEPGYSPSAGTIALCEHGTVSFMDFDPQQVTVKITWSGGSYSTTGSPIYTSFQPNGRYCPPECRGGKLQVSMH